ncbi:MAG: tetratricopeptide repeat protein [Ktedonobacteraceae bacterium]
MTDYGKRYHQAEAYRKNGQFKEAEELFRDLWDEYPNPNVGWRWIYCLRKLESTQKAIEVARQVEESFPDDEWVRREHAWCIYSCEVKPAQSQRDLEGVVRFAQQMMDLAQDELIATRATFAVIEVAKDRGKWEVVSRWCSRLDPRKLSSESNTYGEHKGMSDLEQWYYAKVKALVNLKQWSEVRELALEAAVAFPRKDDFPRWAAQARAYEGDLAGAVEKVEGLIRHGNAQWYILSDLAQMKLRQGLREEALQVACRAALAFGEDKAKVNLFSLLAELGLALGQVEFAAYHVALAKAVRLREGWSLRDDLLTLGQRVNAALTNVAPVELPTDPRQLLLACQVEWHKQVSAGKPRYTGRICNLPAGKKFGFIAPDAGGENILVPLRDLPRTAQAVGACVEYSLEPSFDHKKNRESFRAVEVRVASSSKAGNSGR